MSEQTNSLVQLFSKFLRNPKVLMALHSEMRNERLRSRQGRNGAQGLLVQLWKNDGLTNTEISELLDIKPSSVTNQVKNLEARDLVKRVADENDKRVSRVFLTDAGRALEDARTEEHDEASEQIFGALDEEERAALAEIMQKLIAENQGDDDFDFFDEENIRKFGPMGSEHHRFGNKHQMDHDMRREMQRMGNEMRREMWRNNGWDFGKWSAHDKKETK